MCTKGRLYSLWQHKIGKVASRPGGGAYLEVCVDVRLDLASLVLSAAVSRRLRLRQGREEAILQPTYLLPDRIMSIVRPRMGFRRCAAAELVTSRRTHLK